MDCTDPAPAIAAGLTRRPLDETIADTLAWHRAAPEHRPLGIPDEPPARGRAALDLAGPGTIITGMASETATPDLLTALLEHIRVLLGADHALYSEWEPERGVVTNLAWTGTLDSPEVATVGLSHPISTYVDDGVELGTDAFPPLEPKVCDAADPACDEKTLSYLRRVGVAREAYVHLPCREGGYHELEVFFRDRDREIGEADLAVLVDLGRLATVSSTTAVRPMRCVALSCVTARWLSSFRRSSTSRILRGARASPTPTASATCSATRLRSGRPIRRRSGSERSTPTTSRG